MFSVPSPSSSEPPSTPIASRRSLASNPSTTPAGPPPFQSSAREPPSFTPAGAPPSTVFGSSQQGRKGSSRTSGALFGAARGSRAAQPTASRSLFSTTLGSEAGGSRGPGGAKSGVSLSAARGRTFEVPPSSPPGVSADLDLDQEEEGDAEDEDYEEDSQDGMMVDGREERRVDTAAASRKPKTVDVAMSIDRPEGFPDVRALARGTIAALPPPKLTEPDALILRTEDTIDSVLMGEDEEERAAAEAGISDQATRTASKLRLLWANFGALDAEERQADEIGPKKDNSPVAKANFLASLLLQLYQPSTDDTSKSFSSSTFGRASQSALVLSGSRRPAQMPKVMFDWLNLYHDPGAKIMDEVLEAKDQGFAASDSFWDAVYCNTYRGRFKLVIELLENANFPFTGPRRQDGPPNYGYSNQQLQHISQAIEQALRLLQSCPAVRDDNWDIKGSDWRVFRRRVEQAIEGLREFAEPGSQYNEYDEEEGLGRSSRFGQSSTFGRSSGIGLSESTRRAESLVPFEIFDGLLNTYNVLLGKQADLLQSSFSWVEGTLGLAAWWDGDEENLNQSIRASGSLAASRRSLMRSQNTRTVDVTPAIAYRQRIAQTFEIALIEGADPEEGGVDETFDSTDPLHVGLACIMTGDVSSAVEIIRGFSITMAAALTELGSEAGWLPNVAAASSRGAALLNGFDESDLMVLNYGQDQRQDTNKGSRKDEILINYADLLVQRPVLEDELFKETTEGSSVALRVLSRVDDFDLAESRVDSILGDVDLKSEAQVDALLNLCMQLDFTDQAAKLADRYASTVQDHSLSQPSTPKWGDVILYYARAHQPQKVKEIVDMLISMSLLNSAAYPSAPHLDQRLKSLIDSPKDTLEQLDSVDSVAAGTISSALAGYANLRRFYERRDICAPLGDGEISFGSNEDIEMGDHNDDAFPAPVAKSSSKRRRGITYAEVVADGEDALPHDGDRMSDGGDNYEDDQVSPLQRRKDAASCLLIAIASAADSIRGGLFDPSVERIMPVDGILTLLGEALPFVNRNPRILTLQDLMILLRATEDISTIGAKIYSQADAFLQQSIAQYNHQPEESSQTSAKPSTSKVIKTRSKSAASSNASNIANSTSSLKITPRALLRKSTSGLTNASSFDMVGSNGSVEFGSGVLGGSLGGDDDEGSGVFVDVVGAVEDGTRRAWDWRKGVKPDARGAEVLAILRYGVAQEIAAGWTQGEGLE